MPTVAEINEKLYRPIRSGVEYEAFMPYSDCSSVSLGKGTTDFGIQEMAKWVKRYQHHTKKLAPKLQKKNLLETCKSIKDFSFWNFQYKLDVATQQLRSPACSWASRKTGIDCKSYSIFVSSVLLNLNIPHYLRRIKQQGSYPDAFTHVYVVVPKDGKNLNKGYYTIDGTIQPFAEIPYIEKDDVYISADSQGLGGYCENIPTQHLRNIFAKTAKKPQFSQFTPLKVANSAQAWATAMQVIERFEKLYPQNADLHRLKSDLEQYRKTRPPLKLQLDGFTLILNGKRYELMPSAMGLPEKTIVTSDTVDAFANEEMQRVANEVEQRSEFIRVATYNLVNSTGDTLASVAETVGKASNNPKVKGFAKIAQAAIEVVTLLVSLWVMFGYDPCEGAEYMPEPIKYRLKNSFLPNFKRNVQQIEKAISMGVVAGITIHLNELLKEVDLGVAHYNAEKSKSSLHVCSKQTLNSYKDFVQGIKNTVDFLYLAVKAVVRDDFKITETQEQGFSREKVWHFIIPTTQAEIFASYRKIRLDNWNKNARSLYPFDVNFTFETWAETNRTYLNVTYHDQRGERYIREIMPYGAKIRAIRSNLYLRPSLRYSLEQDLRVKEMLPIYLKYDTDYTKSLQDNFKREVEARILENKRFIGNIRDAIETKDEHKKLKEAIEKEGNHIRNRMKIKQLLSVLMMSLAGIFVIKSM